MEEARMRVNESGRVVIPSSFRKALGIRPGDEVVIRVEEGELRISTLEYRVRQAQQMVSRYLKPGELLSDELIADRRREAELE